MPDYSHLLTGIDTVLFDMDGTIVNTEPLHAKAGFKLLQKMNLAITPEEMVKRFYGISDYDVIRSLFPSMNDQEIHEHINQKNQLLIQALAELNEGDKNIFITPGLFDFLNYLKDHKIKMAVVSASEDEVVKATMATFKIDEVITLGLGRGQTIKTKPHPDPYLNALKILNSDPTRTLIFEDSPTGLEAAKASKALKVIRITEFAHQSESLNFDELKNFLMR